MPIKRAGPFATTTNPYADAPMTPDESVVPVNCNKHQSATWPWRAFVFEIAGYDQNFAEITNAFYQNAGESSFFFEGTQYDSSTFPDAIDVGVFFRIEFYYQATQEWSFNGSTIPISVVDNAQGLGTSYLVGILVDGTEVFRESEFSIDLTLSKNISIDSVVFPASVVPKRVSIDVGAGAFSTSDATASASISLPLAEN